ncbi:MAG TPA: ATP-binding protein [Oligoflexus sp.]|uniref:sensor histidine kinase n=1 Tax=Oligoflexus sp. TaxID=1971216 RepID=UPI002D80FDF2|nr:ATP-binding protein [Oligoflexus sp.]HET9239629.1 ATP-binding protein [Oligoflexus sp.]
MTSASLWGQTLVVDRILYREDPSRTLTPEAAQRDLLREARPFEKITTSYSDSTHWFLLEMHALTDDEPTQILHIENPLISELEAWRIEAGTLQPLDVHELRHRHPLLPIQAQAGTTVRILLKIFMPDMTVLSFGLERPVLAPEVHPFNSFSFAFMLAGFAAGLLIYNVILYLSVRDLDLANFSIYAFTLIIATFGATGGWVALGLPPSVNAWFSCLAAISMACALNFTRSFFDMKHRAPLFDHLFVAGKLSNVIVGILLACNLSRTVQYLIDFNMILSLLLCMIFGVTACKRRYPLAQNYLLGMSGYIGALAVYIGLQYGWVERNMWSENAQLFALNFQILVLSSAVGSKISRLRAELLAQLKEANSVLEQKVEERTRTVIEQQQTLIQTAKMASLGEMAGGIAHEINNPLMIISGYAENLATAIRQGQMNETRALAFHERIQKATDRIRKIISGLQNLSRVVTDDECHEVTLGALIRDALSLCESRFSHQGVALRVKLPEPDVTLRCNAGQICQVLINLLNNAYDAIEHEDEPWVEIRVEDRADCVRIRIFDCGTGIPPTILQRIFDPFYTTKEIGKGTGLGLSISKSLIERQGGRIYVDQNQPHTCFVIELGQGQNPAQRAA